MVMTEKEFCEKIHMLIHLVRLDTEFKANSLDKQIGLLVIEKYKDVCEQCKQREELMKVSSQKPKQSIFKKIMEAADK
jgi:hypothetical protein